VFFVEFSAKEGDGGEDVFGVWWGGFHKARGRDYGVVGVGVGGVVVGVVVLVVGREWILKV
jgi:hypothetical protein